MEGNKILVVDDEASVRNMIAAMLRQAGYSDVLVADDGQSALETLEQIDGQVRLVITDIRMPGMDGSALTAHILQKYPEVKVLCISGFADPLSPNGHYFLPKPFTSTALTAIVHHVLDVPPSH